MQSAEIYLHQTGFAPKAPVDWDWAALPALLRAMGVEMVRKWSLFVLIFGVTAAGLRAWLLRKDAAWTIAGCVCGGYFLFLIAAYIGSSFGAEEVARAASFYRYMSHVALLALIPVWRWAAAKKPSLSFKGALGLVALAGLFPLVFALKPAWLVVPSRPALCADRALGRKIVGLMKPGERLCYIDPDSNGMSHFIVREELALDDLARGSGLAMIRAADRTTPVAEALKSARDPACDLVYLRRAEDEKRRAVFAPLLSEGEKEIPAEGAFIRSFAKSSATP
jgi:hypothetical protein